MSLPLAQPQNKNGSISSWFMANKTLPASIADCLAAHTGDELLQVQRWALEALPAARAQHARDCQQPAEQHDKAGKAQLPDAQGWEYCQRMPLCTC